MTKLKFAASMILFAAGLSAATDPFVGKWKWNAEKSPQPKSTYSIKEAGDNRYTITFNGYSETLKADGVQTPSPDGGGSMSLKKVDDHKWEVVRIQGSKYVATDTISPDEKTLTVSMVSHLLSGEIAKSKTTYTRVGTGRGLVGDWEAVSRKSDNPGAFDAIIEPFEEDGLTFSTPYDKWQVSLHLDGKRYYDQGPGIPKGLSSSAKRIDPHTIQFVGEINEVLDNSGDYKLSDDEKTMTMTMKPAKGTQPIIYVYDRQ
jgi:hypothetical protein